MEGMEGGRAAHRLQGGKRGMLREEGGRGILKHCDMVSLDCVRILKRKDCRKRTRLSSQGVHKSRTQSHTRRHHHLISTPAFVLLDNLVNQTLSLVPTQAGKVVSDVGDVITARIVRFAGVHRVVREVATAIISMKSRRGKRGHTYRSSHNSIFPS